MNPLPPPSYDVYEPVDYPSKNNMPTLVYMHGGAWFSGHRHQLKEHAQLFTELGYRVITPTYELRKFPYEWVYSILLLTILSPLSFVFVIGVFLLVCTYCYIDHHTSYTPFYDMCTVVNHVRHTYPLSSMYAIGYSAGVHIVCMIVAKMPNIFNAVVCISGVYSPFRLKSTMVGYALHHSIFGRQNIHNYPLLNVSREHTPPTLLINAQWDYDLMKHTLDYFVWLRQNHIYVTQYTEMNVTHQSIMYNWHTSNLHCKIHEFITHIQQQQQIK
jgi:pimeloyl-ACP methyl ester carboxylesterase